MIQQIKHAIANPTLPQSHGIIFALGFTCFGILGAEFGFGISHLVTLWVEQGGIIWFQLATWAIAVLPLLILFFIFCSLHSQRGGGQ